MAGRIASQHTQQGAAMAKNINLDAELGDFVMDEGGEESGALRHVKPDEAVLVELREKLLYLLQESQGEIIYELGLGDAGEAIGLNEEEARHSLETLKAMVQHESVTGRIKEIATRQGKKGLVYSYLVRQEKEHHYLDVRLAVCGNVDAGKSTLIGVLTRGKLDDGRGLVRSEVFQHKHEQESGRTSSISQQILGFNVDGECVNTIAVAGDEHRQQSWGDIVESSYKVISFFDLAGHEKYLKTTVAGMTGQMPDYALLLIGANMGVTKMTKEHLGLALALKIPLIVLITKIDICPPNILEQTVTDITRILRSRGVRKLPVFIRSSEDVITAAKNIPADRMVPLFQVSSVTGLHLDLLRQFLNAMPPRLQWDRLKDKPCEILIDQSYHVTGVGAVVSGTVMAGRVSVNDTLLLGPDGNGNFIPAGIKSIHCKRVPVDECTAGMSASMALKKIKRSQLRRGMVLAAPAANPVAAWTFEAEVIILYHSTTVQPGYQPVIQCMAVRQSARIVSIQDREVLRTGDRATVRFRFMYRPEYLKIGMRLVIREGQCKGIGILSKIVTDEPEEEKKPVKHPHQKDK